jgi:hypothetical protein
MATTNFSLITGPNDHRPHEIPPWEENGVFLAEGLIPDSLIDAYVRERRKILGNTDRWFHGWPNPTPYMQVESMRGIALYRPLMGLLKALIGEEAGLHLCLTGFQSTERAWHQDRYLNPEGVGERYIAAWIALDDVHPDSGPFQYVPGSHRWPVIERKRVWDRMAAMGHPFDHRTWPSDSQGWVGEACADEIARRGAEVVPFLARRGDVLFWHASLMHRGSAPRDILHERRALICHYSAVSARPDMPTPVRTPEGSSFFPIET